MLVELEREHARAGVRQRERERADSRADLDHVVAGFDAGVTDDAARGVGVREEVLAERLARAYTVPIEERPQLRRVHEAENRRRVGARRLRDAVDGFFARRRERGADRDHIGRFVGLAAVRLRREVRRIRLDEQSVGGHDAGRGAEVVARS